MKHLLLSLTLMTSLSVASYTFEDYKKSNPNAERYDSSKIYSLLDRVNILRGKIFYCSPGFTTYKIDLINEELTFFTKEKVFMVTSPIIDISETKSSLIFKTVPSEEDVPKQDTEKWNRWFLDKISLDASYIFWWPRGKELNDAGIEDKYLDPIEMKCLSKDSKRYEDF